MKEIKTRSVVKDIKRLDRFPNVLHRVRRSSDRAKRQVENDKTTSSSPVEYAQRHSAAATKKNDSCPNGDESAYQQEIDPAHSKKAAVARW